MIDLAIVDQGICASGENECDDGGQTPTNPYVPWSFMQATRVTARDNPRIAAKYAIAVRAGPRDRVAHSVITTGCKPTRETVSARCSALMRSINTPIRTR